MRKNSERLQFADHKETTSNNAVIEENDMFNKEEMLNLLNEYQTSFRFRAVVPRN